MQVRLKPVLTVFNATARFILLLAFTWPALAQTPDYPLSHKGASEFTVRFTECVMHGGPGFSPPPPFVTESC